MTSNNEFSNGSPKTPKDWLDKQFSIIPCKNKVPVVTNWQKENFKVAIEQWTKLYKNHNIGLLLLGLIDFDIDNHFINRFLGRYLKTCGAIYGRKSNPESHYLFLGELKSFKYVMPKELESYCKDFPHGNTLCEIRSGSGHQSIVPSSVVEGEDVVWSFFANINSYDGDLEADISKIALSTALSILYPAKGSQDNYCTAVAGILAKHTPMNETDINVFVHNLAVCSNDSEPHQRMAKGTSAKNSATKSLGMPTIAKIVGCTVKSSADLFSWVGVKDSGSSFTALRCYITEPKYWQLEYKGKWITIMDSSMLLSYTKISILILENCYEVAPVINPKDWKEIVSGLLQSVQKIDTPYEASYYGNIGIVFIDWCSLANEDKVSMTEQYTSGTWYNSEDKHLYFRLEHFTRQLRTKQLSFEMRKMTHFLREEFGAVPTKITVSKKEVRVWKVPAETVANHQLNNKDKSKEAREIASEAVRKRMEATFEKSRDVF